MQFLILVLLLILPSKPATSETILRFFDPLGRCQQDCHVSIYSGLYLKSEMSSAFGLSRFEPPVHWRFSRSGLLAATFGRSLYEVSPLFRVEYELGVGKRFGTLTAIESWGALYFRWQWFPWNHHIRTSIAVSTGLSYTPRMDRVEVERTRNGGKGSRLLHFLSPEVTFGLPSRPDIDLFFRYHHRSGGRNFAIGKSRLFNSSAGGAQYLGVGMRMKY